MAEAPIDPQWPRILSILGHEMRNPISPLLGYLRMVDRVGPLNEKQQHMLQEVEKACGRISKLLAEISDLHKLETRKAAFNRRPTDLHDALTAALAQLPPEHDVHVEVVLALDPAPAPFSGDPTRLATAFASLIHALRRELSSGETLKVEERRTPAAYEFRLGTPQSIAAFDTQSDAPQIFDEWREGVGLSLPVARRIFDLHDGHLYAAPAGHKVGARVVLPR